MTNEESQNLATIERARQRWNAGDLDGYLSMYDPSIVLHGYAGVGPGFGQVEGFYRQFWGAFSASALAFEDVFASGDRVAIRFTLEAIHSGPFQGIATTGTRISLPGITILRFRQGKCVERWSQADFLGLLGQLGATGAPGGVQ